MLVFIGKYPLKYIAVILGVGIIGLMFFILVAKAFPDAFPNRVDTWINRIDNFTTDKPDEDDYQIEKAKIAIASGGIYGLGPGKSVQKNFLPQSSSDFIYAIIVEEYGLFGGLLVLGMYLLLLFRFVVAAHKANSLFGKLVVVGLGFPIIFQAMTNMAVAVELLPVTGQTLPLISSGGSSIWMTCIALGIILSVTKKEEEIAEENAEKQKREDALQKLIDKQLQEDEEAEISLIPDGVIEDYTIEDKSVNPMMAIKGVRVK
jgi:cell division protein FtsW